MGIGKRIKERREALNLKQEELARLVGVTASAIGNYENGVSHPKEPVLYKLFTALMCDANYLYQDVVNSKKQSQISQTENTLIDNFRHLNDEGQKKVVDYLSDLTVCMRYKRDEKTIDIYRAAKSNDNRDHEIVSMPRHKIEKLKQLPKVTTEDKL
ncbi:MAG: helix-turn-helix domain-containing protein [Eubacterium sp.]|jgi:transcriptional regulator with XRE-family HTH domain|nr:helix-turn-helix domain-containing protein [Eubacterium sp.]